MCIAILNTTGTLSKKVFRNCWEANPDGAGLTYWDGANIQIIKEMKSYKTFHESYLSVRKLYPDVDIAIHFRIATHGKVNVTNCHPFKVNRRTAFIHNGMITHLERHPDFSDTYLFNESIVKQLPANFIQNTAILEILGNYIGYSKLVIISGDQSAIVNEQLGTWDGGNWYSNGSYKSCTTHTTTKKTAPYIYKDWDDWDTLRTKYDYKSKTEVPDEPNVCDCCNTPVSHTRYSREFNAFICAGCDEYFTEQAETW